MGFDIIRQRFNWLRRIPQNANIRCLIDDAQDGGADRKRRGEGGPCAERGDFTVGGRIPINPSGGLESKGHPLGATGIGQLFELVTQLRGEAGQRQVQGARNAIQENGGGMQGGEEAALAIHILSK